MIFIRGNEIYQQLSANMLKYWPASMSDLFGNENVRLERWIRRRGTGTKWSPATGKSKAKTEVFVHVSMFPFPTGSRQTLIGQWLINESPAPDELNLAKIACQGRFGISSFLGCAGIDFFNQGSRSPKSPELCKKFTGLQRNCRLQLQQCTPQKVVSSTRWIRSKGSWADPFWHKSHVSMRINMLPLGEK